MLIVLLGASGNAGREMARLLAPRLGTDDRLRLVGRDPLRLSQTRALCDAGAGRGIADIAIHDLRDDGEIASAVAGAGLVVVAASLPDRIVAMAGATLAVGANWLDVMLSSRAKLNSLKALSPEIERRGLTFVTDGGFHPGLPAAMARWAAGEMDRIVRADVHAALRIDWRGASLAPSTIAEALAEFTAFDRMVLKDGRRQAIGYHQCPRVDFGPPFGRRFCVPMPLDEMAALAEALAELRDAAFYIAGFGLLSDVVVFPLLGVMSRLAFLRPAARGVLRWASVHLMSAPPPHLLQLQLAATGVIGKRLAHASMIIRGHDPYLMTAAPPVACLTRMLDGTIADKGLFHQAMVVDPMMFFDDLKTFGIEVMRTPPPQT